MSYKFIQQNVWGGEKMDNLGKYFHDESFDFAAFQELAGGGLSKIGKTVSSAILDSLGKNSEKEYGILEEKVYTDINDENTYLANGLLYKKKFEKVGSEIIWMNDYRAIEVGVDEDVYNRPYQATSATFKVGERALTVISGHFTWNLKPFDTNEIVLRTRKVYDYVRELKNPWILAGDFNISANTVAISQFDDLGINIGKLLRVSNTLNPRLHRATHLFPKGVDCDQVIVSRDIEILKFAVEHSVDISDHFGLVLEFDFREDSPTVG